MDHSVASPDILVRIAEIEKQFDDFSADEMAQDEDDENDHKILLDILRNACALVRDSGGAGVVDATLVVRVNEFINRAVEFAYEEREFDYIPSYAHSTDFPEVNDNANGSVGGISHGDFASFMSLLTRMSGIPESALDRLPKPPAPWSTKMKPHPNTTPLSRFREDIPPTSVCNSTTLANIIYQARCEVSSYTTSAPTDLAMSSGYSCLVVPSAGGYKNRCPGLSYFLLGIEDGDFVQCHDVEVGLSGIAYNSTTDESRKLIFIADDRRIKSYVWGDSAGDGALPTHTLSSGSWGGPLAMFPNGRIIRAGNGSAGFWDIDSMETHGLDGNKRIGKRFKNGDTCRDDPEDIEDSSGSKQSGTITFGDSHLSPKVWHHHPSTPSAMLCASGPPDTHDCSCVVLDLEHGGLTSTRYLGHGGTVCAFSTSIADGNVFTTACSDGYTRLYDIRHPLPVLTLNVGELSEVCPAAVLAHPDGIPTIFTGSDRSEQIKLWDVRARAAVYELSTGNNSVHGMAWDSSRHVLYATTGCEGLDRMGYHHGYRKAKISKAPKPDNSHGKENDGDNDEEWEDEEEEEDSEDDDDYDGKNWPERAYHAENYFGYMFDAGDHRIFRYAFKADANPAVLPAYGDATRGDPYDSCN